MKDLRLIENGLIPVYSNRDGDQVVNARELHDFLDVGRDFTTWIKDKILKYSFVENEDYCSFTEIGEREIGATRRTVYILKLDIAKEIAMVENNEKGRQVRKYFIEVEKRYKQLTKPKCIEDVLIESLQEMKAVKMQIQTAIEETAAVKEEVQDIRDVIAINPKAEWRKQTNDLLAKVCKKNNDYKLPKEEAYKALEQRANCKLKIRLENMRGRALKEGMARSKADSLNFLDVIEGEARLKEIYIAIVKEMAIKNGVSINQ